jgi:hypothetical protein
VIKDNSYFQNVCVCDIIGTVGLVTIIIIEQLFAGINVVHIYSEMEQNSIFTCVITLKQVNNTI